MNGLLRRATALADRFAERAAEHDEAASFPKQDFDDIRAEGFTGLMVPESLGGFGAGFEDYVHVASTFAQGSGSTALIFNMHASVTGGLASVPEEVARALGAGDAFFEARDRFLRAAVEGALYGVAITEPEAGSRLSKLQTSYEPDGDGYRIRGLKSACSGAGHLDAYLVAARRVGSGDPDPVLSYFLVPADAGLTVEETWDPLGMRATASNSVHLDARVSAEALLGAEGLVLPLAYSMPQWLVASYAAVYVGVAEAAVQAAIQYLGERTVAGERGGLALIPSVRQRVGRAEAQVAAARLALLDAARRVDIEPGTEETNRWVYRAKLLAGDACMDAAAGVAEACGLGALRKGSPLERIYRDARFGALMPPASDVAADWLGGAALGVDDAGARPW
jgi:alkylation response protein AidB-like acyl-CoA dehydrogenase